ncbi:sodium:solute symporter family protein [Natranaeroarchaeum aerophilus]|uniref:Sodium:solute symporter family protein n=1 Tax=Natranaeroarchaeum aerophilus TaxID=2917711 RepID=A0AAE3K4P7_9EURY|nr:sodium:solute symporter family protein [Natranaeroarchaeum aerophilus]MCL9812785.1 sodium:solute symporter family protein [Natranaeroarchaeum aerophilus]
MNAIGIQLGIVVAYLCLALVIGLLAYRVTERTAEDFYLASRSFGTIVLLFTTFATLLSAFTFFGGPDIAYQSGPEWILVMGLMDGIIFAILWYVIGYKQWLIGNRHGYVTLGEMLGDRFGSMGLRGLVAVVSLFWLFPYVMLQQMGAGAALTGLTDGWLPYWAGAALVTVFMIVYVVLAGMRGIAWTDTLQGAFMLGITWVAALWVLDAVGGAGAATASVADSNPEFLALGSSVYTPEFMLSTAISIGFGVAMFPQVNQRFFTAGSKTVFKRTFVLWPVLVVLLFVPAFLLGTWAAGLGIDANIDAGESVLPILLNEYTPVWFAALVIAGAMAAMMSSSDSMLLSGSSYFTRDVYRPFINADISDRREDLLGRIGVVVFAAATFVASLGQPGTLVEIGELAFSGFAQLAFPVIVALYWRKTTLTGMYAGIGGSQLFYLLARFTSVVPATYFGWNASVVGMLLGLVLTVGVSAATSAAADERHSRFLYGVETE